MGDHVRLLSFSSASSPQAPVLTAPNGQCMLPRTVVLHSEACFARQKRPREENSTPPKWPPRSGQQIARGLTSPCPSRAEHETFYGTQGRQQLTTYSMEPPSFPTKLGVLWMELTLSRSQSSNKRWGWRLRKIAQRTRMHCRRLQKCNPFVTQRDILG